MGTQEFRGESHADPTIPLKGDVCLINNLPPELLSRIFEVGTEGDSADGEDEYFHDTSDEEDIHDHDAEKMKGGDQAANEEKKGGKDESTFALCPPFPIIVSHVCCHWRDIALSTPSLWTTIMFVPQSRRPYKPESVLLERSKSLPIDIYVKCDGDDEDDDFPPSLGDLKSLSALLIPHIHRWRTMEVSVSDYCLMYAFLQAVSEPSVPPASQLQTLELYDYEETEDHEVFQYPSSSKHFTLFSGSAPLLTTLVLWGVHVDWDQPWITSAPNLRDLELAYHTEDVRPTWAQFATILRGAPSLKKLGIRQSGPSGDPTGWFIEPTAGGPTDLNAPIQLLWVKQLIFMFQPPAYAIGLLRKLYLPALKSLYLDFDGDDDYTDFAQELARPTISLVSAQEQPRSLLSNLTYLKLSALPCGTECVERLYGELQNLTSLEISLDYLHPHFLITLLFPCSLPGRITPWLPRLERLKVSGTSGGALRELVSKRREAGVPLASLWVELQCDVDDADAEWLKENVKTFIFYEGSEDELDDEDDEDDEDNIGDEDGAEDEWSDT